MKKVPAIRFKGFSDSWAERNFLANIEKIIDFRGRTPKKLGLDWSESGYLALSALNVKSGYIDFKVDAHYGNQELYDKWMLGNQLHKNQVLFTTEAPMGNVAQIPDDEKYILSQRTIAFEVKPCLLAEDFLAIVLGSPITFKKLTSMSSGGTAKGVSQKSLAGLDLTIPSDKTEQSQIGSYFQRLDKLISLHQTKVNKLTNLKKAMLEKMFPKQGADEPEIRFKGFAEAWMEMKLSDMSDYKNGKGHEDKQLPSGRYELINLNSISIDGGLKHSGKYINETDSTLNKNDLVMVLSDVGHGDLLGRVALIPENNKYVLNQRVALLRPKLNVNPTFMFYDINAHQIYFKSQGAGMSQLNLSKSSVENFTSQAPTMSDEQEKIGSFFQNLDKLIIMNKTELEKLNNLKKACLEKMFV